MFPIALFFKKLLETQEPFGLELVGEQNVDIEQTKFDH